jgi:hypothetical protein
MTHIGYFDIHLWGADPVKNITYDTIISDNNDKSLVVFLCGDIIDRKNVLKKYVKDASEAFIKLKDVFGEKYRTGNHEVGNDNDFPLLYQGWGICHTDMIFNGEEESRRDRSVIPGAGFLSRLIKGIASNARDSGLLSFHSKLDDLDFQNRFIKYCDDFGIEKGIIGGHKHPTEKIVKQIGKYTLVIYPRGRWKIDELN